MTLLTGIKAKYEIDGSVYIDKSDKVIEVYPIDAARNDKDVSVILIIPFEIGQEIERL
jgi:hypothetical protein